jgi:hypothetical protein
MKLFTCIGAIFFILIGIIHLLRIMYGVEVMAGTYVLPMWMSYFGFIVPILIGVMIFKEMKHCCK